VIEMQWTPEIVKAEMDYRQHVARNGVTVEHLRAARRAHPSLWKRLRWHN
jgi:hypothetical protein